MNRVLVFGGTHGNEWTGIYVIKKAAHRFSKKFSNLELEFIHANPEAFKINKRFQDEDLNRAFQFLNEDRPHSYEHKRAKEIKAMIDESPCFVLDLHTTTSNMGNTIIISHPQPLNFHVASLLANTLSDTRIILSLDPSKKYLAGQSEFGFMIEVGPIANGVINSLTLFNTVNLVEGALEILSNSSNLATGSLEIYEEFEDVYYPLNEAGELMAIVHKDFQGKDFLEVEGRYVPFSSFEGEDICLWAKEKLYPIFINEAAYYPSKLAFTLCKKRVRQY